jgi:transposase
MGKTFRAFHNPAFHNTMELTREEQLGRYIAETGATVRQASAKFGVSKSTVPMVVVI